MTRPTHLTLRALAALTVVQGAIGCSRFVWKEDPFTPDQAPVTEVVAFAGDTTYVLRGASYYLLAQERDALWNREVLDDVAWRYRALFGEAPPTIAVKLDSAAAPDAADSTWRGMPFATIAPRRRPAADNSNPRDRRERPRVDDSVRARLLMRPMLVATAAETWLKARALSSARGSESEPGGAERPAPAANLPAWMEAGALRILANGGAPDRAAAELRANPKEIVPLASLFAVRWQRRPNAMEIAQPGSMPFDAESDRPTLEAPAPARQRHDSIPGVSSLFIAQSVSVLAFIHEREASAIARLAEELPRGASVESVLASSRTLPRDLPTFEAEWRKWLQRSARRR